MASGVTKEVSRQRQQQAWKLRVEQQWTQAAVAQELGISQPAVSQMLNGLNKHAEAQLTDLAKQAKIDALCRLDALYVEAMKSWHRSKQGVKRRRQKRSGRLNDASQSSVLTDDELIQVSRPGDPRFLDAALEIQRQMLVIAGVLPAAKRKRTTAGKVALRK